MKEPKYYLLQNQTTKQWQAYRINRYWFWDTPLCLEEMTWLGDVSNKQKWLKVIEHDRWMRYGRFVKDKFIREDL